MTKGCANHDEKHWMFMNIEKGNILFIAICQQKRNGSGRNRWFLSEYINYFSLDSDQLHSLIKTSYDIIINKAKKADYAVQKHTFNKEQFNRQYWRSILHSKPIFNARYKLFSPINKKRFETEIKKLFRH